ncbi:MAG TPA: hypothetical protein VK590_03880 [Saprospiraceae bacterium]|nr:hypothetical protein [Saprospiraceae bacterium]
MKYLFIIYFIICCTFFSYSQTYIGPLIGYDLTKIESNPFFEVQNKSFTISSPCIGVKIEQIVTKSIFLTYQLYYTQKNGEAYTHGIVPIFGFKFDYLQNNFSLKCKFFSPFYFGVGFNYNMLRHVKIEYSNFDDEESPLLHENAWQLSAGLKYHNFDFGIYYNKGITAFKDNRELAYFRIEPIQSIGICVSYDLKLFNRIKLFDKKGQSCPAF